MNFIKRYPVTIYSTIGAMLYVAGYFFDAAYDASGFEGFLFYIDLLFSFIFMMVAFALYVIVNVFGLNTHGDTLVSLSIFIGLAASYLIDHSLFSPGRKKDQEKA